MPAKPKIECFEIKRQCENYQDEADGLLSHRMQTLRNTHSIMREANYHEYVSYHDNNTEPFRFCVMPNNKFFYFARKSTLLIGIYPSTAQRKK